MEEGGTYNAPHLAEELLRVNRCRGKRIMVFEGEDGHW